MRRTTVLRSKKHFWAPTKTFRAVSSGQYAFPTVSADSACVSFFERSNIFQGSLWLYCGCSAGDSRSQNFRCKYPYSKHEMESVILNDAHPRQMPVILDQC